ncbi:MAG: integral rane sensor signal transduction histidine kinase [Actinomycetia bacterium]|nr:integral rane sensor signal transduction histidine kinase [Actinomycetes bacterium]
MRSLLGRSVLAAIGGIVLAIVVVGAGVDVLASRDLHRSLDRSLRQRAVEISQLSASAPALLTRPGALDTTLGGTQLRVEVLDRHNRIVARSLALGGRVLPARQLAAQVIARGRGTYGTASAGGERLRLYAAPLADFGGPAAGGAVVVAASERDLSRTVGNLHLFLVLAGLVAAALAALGVFLLLRRALRPVTRLADAAADVERTGDPRRRLPLPETNDEVGRLADTLNAMLASLERSRDLERRFLADASHELRTPLTALRGNVAYLARHGANAEVLADLERDAERLAGLADSLLTLSREEAAAAPRDLVRLDLIAAEAAGGDGRIDVVAREPVTVHGDAASLERALDNLLQNARTHGPAGGRIVVALEEADGVARLSVTDEGPGLRAEEAKLAFQRFWRRGSEGPGSGLGLAIVRATAERHAGRAYAEGARFTIELPALRKLSGSIGTTRAEEPEKGLP